MIRKPNKNDKVLVSRDSRQTFMNHKINWVKRGRMSGAVLGIPVRFDPCLAFDVKVKKSHGKSRVPDLEPPLVSELFELHTRGDHGLRPMTLFKKGSAIASVTLQERTLVQRRLEAVFKTGRKKRC
jgi:hypothetical protein